MEKIKEFTQVPNSLLRNPKLSGKAKIIFCLLLSNKEKEEGEIYQTTTSISKMMKEGVEAINSAIQELEQNGYLMRYKYRDKKTKSWKGSFWAYTDSPHNFNIQKNIDLLDSQGLEIYFKGK